MGAGPVAGATPLASAPERNVARELAFVRAQGIYTINTEGKGLRKLAALGRKAEPIDSPRWSPTGDRIAFEGRSAIFVASYRRSRVRQLTTPRPRKGFDFTPTWSRRGAWIAYTTLWGSAVNLHGAISLVRSDGRDFHRLTRRPIELETSPDWSPDGRLIAFSADGGTFVMTPSGADRHRVARHGSEEAWSPNGKLIAILGQNGGVYVVRRDGSDLRTVAAPGSPGTAGPFPLFQLAWSPDSRTIAWSHLEPETSPPQAACEIWVASVAGNSVRQLTAPPPNRCDSYPTWAPKSDLIAFGRVVLGGQAATAADGIYVVHSDGTGLQMLPGTQGADEPAWRP